MLSFFKYWYLQSFGRFWLAYLESINQFENTLAVKDTAVNLRKPLFQDYTTSGRVIGFLIRLVRIGAGLVLYTLISLIYLFLYLLWLAFPLICIISILGAMLATKSPSI